MSTSSPRDAAYSVPICQDVLREIVGYLSPGWFPWDHCDGNFFLRKLETDLKPRRHLQKTLLSCALTCRAWSDIALAELWKVLDHHVFLLKLLPGDDGLFDEVIDLRPDIDDKAWSRFRWYARLVRKMKTHVHRDVHIGFHHDTWIFLASRLQGEPLLPSLRHLQMPANTEDIMPFLFCLSPTICTFTLEFECGFAVRPADMDFLTPFLAFISDPPEHALHPKLRQIFTSQGDAEEIMHHLRTSARLIMLEELDLTKIGYRIDHASVAALSRLPSLHTLKLELAVREFAMPLFTFTSFGSLRHLSLNTMPLPTLSTVLATGGGLRATPLQSVDLRCDTFTQYGSHSSLSLTDLQHHLALIRAALPDTLEAFRFWLDYSISAETPLPLTELFAPFLSLSLIVKFDLSLNLSYVPHVADDDLRALARAWPRLEELHIYMWDMRRSPNLSGARSPTIAGLVDLATACPRLRRVTLPALDVSVLLEMSASPAGGYRDVQFLDVCALVKDEGVAAEDVARILDGLFPCLEEFPCDREATHPQEISWTQVQGAMREMQGARCGIGCG